MHGSYDEEVWVCKMSVQKTTWRRPVIKHAKPTKYGYTVYYPERFKLGRECDIGWGSFIHAGAGVVIGPQVQIGGGTYIYSVSTIDNRKGLVRIKANARIGAQSTIMPGVTIGKNALVGAHSFVKIDVPDNEFAAGCPAKIMPRP